MAHWHPTSALVGLPGMPGEATRSINLHGPGRGWRRRRRGHSYEWLESSLPAETQTALAERRFARAAQARAQGLPDERHAAIAAARLDILTALDRWLDAEPRGRMDDALTTFAALYAAGEVDIEPETRTRIRKVSRRMLYDWRALRREGGGTALIPRYKACGQKTSRIDADTDLARILESYIFQFYPRDSAPDARDWLIAKCGEDRVPHLATVKRWMANFRKVNRRRLSAETDPDGHRSRFMPAFGDAAAGVTRINQRWELDSTIADMLCADGRHALIQVFDVYSRRALVLVTPTSRSTAIAAVLRRALLEWGVADVAVTDQGKDYVSRHLRMVLADLEIEHQPVAPFRPDLKPFVERFFRTLQHGLFERLPGYCGHDVAERTQIRGRKSFAERYGKPETHEVALTAAELQAYIDNWIKHVYEHKSHSGLDGRSPFEAAAGQPVKSITDERALDLLLAPPPKGGEYRKVHKDGLHIGGGVYAGDGIARWLGFDVRVRLDPTDWGVVRAFAGHVIPAGVDMKSGQFICKAVDLNRLGKERAELAAREKAHAQDADREGRAHARQRKREWNPDVAMDDILQDKAGRSGQVLLFPPREKAHETPALDEAAKAHQGTVQPDGDLDFLAKFGHLYENRFLKEEA